MSSYHVQMSVSRATFRSVQTHGLPIKAQSLDELGTFIVVIIEPSNSEQRGFGSDKALS